MGFLGDGNSSGGFSSSSGVGYCDNGDFFAEGAFGALVRRFCYPSCNGSARASLYSCGVGVFASPNAHQAQDPAKGFRTRTTGAGVGTGGDFTSASGTGVDGQSVDVYSVSPLGASFGAGTADYDTYTNVASWNWVQHMVNDPLVSAATTLRSWL